MPGKEKTMEVYSIVNLKGGVGKTVTACNLAAILGAFHHKRVLLVDADAQANASRFFGCGLEARTLTGVLAGRCAYWPEYVIETDQLDVSILPADIDLLEQDIASVRHGGRASIRNLERFMDTLAADKAFDIVLFDCPPAFSAASVAAISCSSAVIVPTKLDAWSIAGADEIFRQIDGVRRIRPEIRIAGVLITMFHRAEVEIQGEKLLRSGPMPVFETVIRRTDKVDESTFVRQPLFQWSRTSAAGRDYMRFAEELLEKEAISRAG